MDEFKDIDSELMRLKEELLTKDENLKQVKFPASGDYWRSRLDEERVLWDKRTALGSEERKALERKLTEQDEMLSHYNQSVKEMERKIENDTKLWEERMRIKETDILIEKNRLQSETRVKEIELERQRLLEKVTELSTKITEVRDEQILELEKLKDHSKRDSGIYEEKLKLASAEAQALKNRTAEIETSLNGRIGELASLKEEYRVRFENSEIRVREELAAKAAVENDALKARSNYEEQKNAMRANFEGTAQKFGGTFGRDVGVLSGFAQIAAEHRLKNETLLVVKSLTGKVQSEIKGFEKELNVRFPINDNFKAALVMAEDEAAYWQAALSGTQITTFTTGIKKNYKRDIAAQKPCVCVVSSKFMKAAEKIKKKWPFIPVMIYGELTEKLTVVLKKQGFITLSSYGTADDMILLLADTAQNSAAYPEYWDKIKIKSVWAVPAAIAASAVVFAAALIYVNNPAILERFGRVASYSVPYSQPSNITFDGQYLWGCDWFGQSIYKHDTGNGLKLLRIFCQPGRRFTAIAWARGSLWSADAWSGKIYRHNTDDNFTILNTYDTPGTSISGLAFDGANFWSCDSSAGMIYKHALDDQLTVEDAFESPGASPSGLFYDGKNLWSVDSKTNKIYRHAMNATLSVEKTFIPPLFDEKNYNLSGIAIKGNRFWVCSEKLGKVFSFPKEKMEEVK